MTPEQYKKHSFCKWELLDLCRAIDNNVLRLEYEADSTGQETVTIVWLQSYGMYRKPVNVTADSLAALARDVLRNF